MLLRCCCAALALWLSLLLLPLLRVARSEKSEGAAAAAANVFPVVGALLQETDGAQAAYGRYYLHASYVRFAEQAGARVLPVLVGQTPDYYESLMRNINGIIFPGGSVDLTTSLYGQAAKAIYRIATDMNDRGEHFALWGTCQGHEEMTTFPTGENLLSNCTGTLNVSLSWNLSPDWYRSRMLRALPVGVLRILSTRPVGFHLHMYCLAVKTYNQTAPLSRFYRVLATNVDAAGLEYVTAMEARQYPFYSVQFHPEKNNYWWDEKLAIDHSSDAVLASQAFSNFLLSEARKGPQRLTNDTFAQQLIDRYPLRYDLGIATYYFN